MTQDAASRAFRKLNKWTSDIDAEEGAAIIRAEYAELVEAARNLRDVKGRHHTAQAYERLLLALKAVEGESK